MPEWIWEYEGYQPGEERLREALCTLGNGYFATRGAAPETSACASHYPGTYVAGCYNRLTSQVSGRDVENEDLVNLPNWLPLRFRTITDTRPDSPWWTPDQDGLLEYRQSLDLRQGTLTRSLRCTSPEGAEERTLRVEQSRLVHMGEPHLAALRTTFTAEGWSGTLEIESALDGAVANDGVERYRKLAGRHLTRTETGEGGTGDLWLRCHTSESDIGIALAARTEVTEGPPPSTAPRLTDDRAAQLLTVPLEPDRPVTVEKTVALHTSRDQAIGDPLHASLDEVARAPGFDGLLDSHSRAWTQLWDRAQLSVPGEAGNILRLHLFHLLQTLSPHTAELDVGVPARGLHGEAYRGHVFWDELFVLPFLNLHLPEVSRALLSYRHRRLGAACRAATDAGHQGAMYPWQSASDGHEETQTLHLNPRSGRWLPDHSHLQHHVNSAIAYNIWHYWQASGDTEFLHGPGAETLLQIARFWAGAAEWDPAECRYRIRGVVGPDEYHEAYPDADRPGLDDNAYTNVTATWVLARALDLLRDLPDPRRDELTEQLALDSAERDRWEEMSRRLRIPFHQGVISQFEGYGELAELDWEGYREHYGDIRRLDRILESEDDTPNRYQASKQADALMLGYLFPPAELTALFQRLGYPLDDALWRRTVDYYLARTSHGSTLSSLVHAWVLTRARRPDAWSHAQEALLGDVADLQGGTTEEGIHLGAMAGTLDLVQRGLTGLEAREDELWLDPAPLPELSGFGLKVRYRGHWGVGIRLLDGQLRISLPHSAESPIQIVLPGRSFSLRPGQSRKLRLTGPDAGAVRPVPEHPQPPEVGNSGGS